MQAFASQYVYCIRKLELDPENLNVNGGAVAFGHPLGAMGKLSEKSCSISRFKYGCYINGLEAFNSKILNCSLFEDNK